MIREYIHKIVDSGNADDMEKLGDILEDVLYSLKRHNEECYNKYMMELYIMANGEVFTDEMAEKVVVAMKPYGKHWEKDQTTEVMKNAGFGYDKNDFFVVMNMAYNDYHKLFGENVESYIKFANLYLSDPDAKPNKAFRNLA